jgi:hypothetical protein
MFVVAALHHDLAQQKAIESVLDCMTNIFEPFMFNLLLNPLMEESKKGTET